MLMSFHRLISHNWNCIVYSFFLIWKTKCLKLFSINVDKRQNIEADDILKFTPHKATDVINTFVLSHFVRDTSFMSRH